MSSANTTLDDITEAMKDVIDPELGINVIDLGLVYDSYISCMPTTRCY